VLQTLLLQLHILHYFLEMVLWVDYFLSLEHLRWEMVQVQLSRHHLIHHYIQNFLQEYLHHHLHHR
jgi:hypothetical protein